jgi:hypothetical protein
MTIGKDAPEARAREEDGITQEQRTARRAAETLGLCTRCGAVLPLGAALTHDCAATPPSGSTAPAAPPPGAPLSPGR